MSEFFFILERILAVGLCVGLGIYNVVHFLQGGEASLDTTQNLALLWLMLAVARGWGKNA